MNSEKDIVVGLGEIGTPILKIISKSNNAVGYDIDPKLMNQKKFNKMQDFDTRFLHICIPFNTNFQKNLKNLYRQFHPKGLIIHSTVKPNTTKSLQKLYDIPVIYSATRGIHKRMVSDMKRYTKFFAIEKNAPNREWAIKTFSKIFKNSNIKTKQLTDTITLELAKIVVDTSYYGWLINFAQLSNIIARNHGVDYDEMWSFSDEIQKYLGNRPKMFPGFIGGHCVIPNLSLIDEDSFWQIDKINNIYAKKVKNAKSIAKKYVKGKQSYNK